jgi:hypothetical protein
LSFSSAGARSAAATSLARLRSIARGGVHMRREDDWYISSVVFKEASFFKIERVTDIKKQEEKRV